MIFIKHEKIEETFRQHMHTSVKDVQLKESQIVEKEKR
ncbi:uncharacterized protein METZ01_LOCUS302639 [marine metagenome]|uniref:Uncharacterized protein n=1 Tax=marine metagenome TaxID=408172 RepID=A0A382MNR5_9ZZZZ